MGVSAIATKPSSNSGLAAVVAIAAGVALIAVTTFSHALDLAARLVQTSDSAQAFVVAHAVIARNVLLSGWHFPVDNYYFTDTLPYALFELFAGSRPFLPALVPALTYALFVLAALVSCARRTRPPTESFVAMSVVALILAAPVWIGAWNPLLLSDMHMATVLGAFAVIALGAGLATNGRRNMFTLIALLLVTTLLVASDPFALVFAFGPALVVLVVGAWIEHASRSMRLAAIVLAGGIACGLALPYLIAFVGGFTSENDVATGFIGAPLFGRNFAAVCSGMLRLFGIQYFGAVGFRALLLLVLRCVALVCVLAAIVRALSRLFRPGVPLLDRMLVVGILTGLIACALSAQFAKGITAQNVWTGGPPMRFLVPAYLFGAILAGRQIPGMLAALHAERLRLVGVTLLGVLSVVTLVAGDSLSGIASVPRWIDNNPPAVAARWLRVRGLMQGVGEYWSANLVTAMSGNAVQVRSIVPQGEKLASYIWVEDARFYTRAPQFVIWRDNNKTGVNFDQVRRTYLTCGATFVAGFRIALIRNRQNGNRCSD